jgi:hypothetical protein
MRLLDVDLRVDDNVRGYRGGEHREKWDAGKQGSAAKCNVCGFESNFPVDKMGTVYATLWNAFKRITAGCSRTEKLALYNGTAKRLYRLD